MTGNRLLAVCALALLSYSGAVMSMNFFDRYKPADFFDGSVLTFVESALEHDENTMKRLQALGVNPNHIGKDRMTPLIFAVLKQNRTAIQMLMRNGADKVLVQGVGACRDQFTQMKQMGHDSFLLRARNHLRQYYPGFAALELETQEDFLTDGFERACAYGLTYERSVMTYLLNFWTLGPDFETRHPEAKAILERFDQPEEARASALHRYTARWLESNSARKSHSE